MAVNRQNISENLFEHQLSLIGRNVQDAINDNDWKEKWYFTPEQAKSFELYAIPLIKRVFKCNRGKAQKTFDFFLLNFGLKVK